MNTVFAWMAMLGVQLDDHQPDARQLAHIAAVRAARKQNRDTAPFVTRLARAVGLVPAPAVAAGPMTSCCPA